MKTVQFVKSKLFHSLFRSPCVCDIVLLQFEFRLKGCLDHRTTAFRIDVIDQEYSTPFIDEASIGDMNHWKDHDVALSV